MYDTIYNNVYEMCSEVWRLIIYYYYVVTRDIVDLTMDCPYNLLGLSVNLVSC